MFSTKRRREVAWFVIGTLSVGLLLLSLYAIFSTRVVVDTVRHQQIQTTQRGKDIKTLATTIQDCTSPDGECYKRGQRRTAAAVGDINRVVILAAACSVGLSPDVTVVERQAEIQSCVLDRLARDAARN